ncbi:MAG: DUF1501 domain-containing protein [Planctomycetota bacterium]|nr:MAG: DUF1501 domain-containing protein [Planctomycetota bacterium]
MDPLNRREWLTHWGMQGLAATALLDLWKTDGLARELTDPARGHQTSLIPKAKRAIHISLVGGMSHLDSFDYKPELVARHGQNLVTNEKPDIFFGQVGQFRRPDWKFARRGQSGLYVSDLFPHIARQADLLTVVKSMVTESANHTPALFFANSGFQFNGFPSLGSWLSFGLGNESDELPTFVVLPDNRGGPNGGAANWSAGFLPAENQGVGFQGSAEPVKDLFSPDPQGRLADSNVRDFLEKINRRHAASHADEPILQARMRSYAIAGKMQLSVPEVGNIQGESEETKELYGLNDPHCSEFGRRCLLARRLSERGVRYIQLFSGGPIAGSPRTSWDAHESVMENHSSEALKIDKPIAALLHDCQRRGLLDDTVILFTTEFGRTPFAQSEASRVGTGRDHNRYGFSVWMAGAGLKPGTSYGNTDEIGWKAAEKPATWHDFHATVLRLFGIDHEKLTYYHNGIQRRLTNVHGTVMKEILA